MLENGGNLFLPSQDTPQLQLLHVSSKALAPSEVCTIDEPWRRLQQFHTGFHEEHISFQLVSLPGYGQRAEFDYDKRSQDRLHSVTANQLRTLWA